MNPILKPKVWGGRALAALGKPLPPGVLIGESWELADLPDSVPEGRSTIANGELAGMTLRQAVQHEPNVIMGVAAPTDDGGFPLLIKYLDAQQNLSVQVHPSPAYAQEHPEAHVKSEAWVVVHAEPGAVIYKGLRPGVTREQFAEHITTGEVVNDLAAVPVQRGDCHYLPSGTCHALGAGIVVAEIQTPSDTTFRVYDWGRNELGRELHIQQALQCIDFGPCPHDPHNFSSPIESRRLRTTPLVTSEHFELERVDALEDADFTLVTNNLPEVWMMLEGRGRIRTSSGQSMLELSPGATVLIPAALNDATMTLEQGAWVLRVTLPSPLKGMLA